MHQDSGDGRNEHYRRSLKTKCGRTLAMSATNIVEAVEKMKKQHDASDGRNEHCLLGRKEKICSQTLAMGATNNADDFGAS